MLHCGLQIPFAKLCMMSRFSRDSKRTGELAVSMRSHRVHFATGRESLLQSLKQQACQTTTPSFRATFTRIFLSPSVAKAAGFFPRTDESSSTLQARPQSSTSGTACPKSAARWLSNPRNWLSRTLRNFILRRRRDLPLGFFRWPRHIFKMEAASTSPRVDPKQRKRPSSSFGNTILKKGSPHDTEFFPGGRAITGARLAP